MIYQIIGPGGLTWGMIGACGPKEALDKMATDNTLGAKNWEEHAKICGGLSGKWELQEGTNKILISR